MLGRVTRQNICQPLAPSISAACSSLSPCACIKGMISRATKGKVTNKVAKIMPGMAKIICMPCASSQPPNAVCAPNNKTNIKPATTGDTENGKSSRVVSNCLPRKSKRVSSHAIATPKTALTGTTISAVISVNLMADHASGSVRDCRYKSQPPFKAS